MSAIRVVFTGPRAWTDRRSIAAVLARLAAAHPAAVLVHGGAAGADRIAAAEAARLGLAVECVPAAWDVCSCGRNCVARRLFVGPLGPYCPAAGPARSRAMLSLPGVIGCLAAVPASGLSGGTARCAAAARALGVPVWAVRPGPPSPPVGGGLSSHVAGEIERERAAIMAERAARLSAATGHPVVPAPITELPAPVPAAPRPRPNHAQLRGHTGGSGQIEWDQAPAAAAVTQCPTCHAYTWQGKPCLCAAQRWDSEAEAEPWQERGPQWWEASLWREEPEWTAPETLFHQLHTASGWDVPTRPGAEIIAAAQEADAHTEADHGNTRPLARQGLMSYRKDDDGEWDSEPAVSPEAPEAAPHPPAGPRVFSLRHTAPEPCPADAVRVHRGTPWGNPYKLKPGDRPGSTLEHFRRYAAARLIREPEWLEPLKGKHLACWCHPNPCHADVLIELANRPTIATLQQAAEDIEAGTIDADQLDPATAAELARAYRGVAQAAADAYHWRAAAV